MNGGHVPAQGRKVGSAFVRNAPYREARKQSPIPWFTMASPKNAKGEKRGVVGRADTHSTLPSTGKEPSGSSSITVSNISVQSALGRRKSEPSTATSSRPSAVT